MNIPFVEKYRPKDFSQIVLEEENRIFFSKITEMDYIPNMLLYGPPGTGKTTTVMNLINQYQKRHGEESSGLMIHLNASDDRGIDTIRIQISNFIQSKAMFKQGQKFIILDEVDSMTKAAQLSLSYLLHSYTGVTVCLICNYISKIEPSLQSMFIKIKFNHLPPNEVISFLKEILLKEDLRYTDHQIKQIQMTYGSDLRSMINYLQIHRPTDILCIQDSTWEDLYTKLSTKDVIPELYQLSNDYNTDIRHLMKDFLYYVSLRKPIQMDHLSIALHTQLDTEHFIRYTVNKLI